MNIFHGLQWTSTKDSLSSWQTDQAALRRDMNYLTGRLHHYYVPSDTEATVTLSLLKWNEINGNFVEIRKILKSIQNSTKMPKMMNMPIATRLKREALLQNLVETAKVGQALSI